MEMRVFGGFLLPGVFILSALVSSCENIKNFKGSENSGEATAETEETSTTSIYDEDESTGGAVALSVDRLKDRFRALLQIEVNRVCWDVQVDSDSGIYEEEHDDSYEESSHEEIGWDTVSEDAESQKEPEPVKSMGLHKSKHGRHPKHKPQHMGAAYCGTQFMKVYDLASIGSEIEINDLMPGDNVVSVSLIDRFGQVMQYGSADAVIVPGQITPVTIQLSSEGGVIIDVIPDDGIDKPDFPEEERSPREPRPPLTWKQADIALDPSVMTSCKGPTYIAFNEAYGLWVGAVTCSKDQYKLVLGKAPEGTFFEIADTAGHGQDHCELVNPKFEISDDDDIKSGGCAECELGEMRDPVGTPALVRGYVGEDF
jgi:hypothetical protein